MNKLKFGITDKQILIYFIINIKKQKDLYNILFFQNVENVIQKYLEDNNYFELKTFIDSLKLSKLNYINIDILFVLYKVSIFFYIHIYHVPFQKPQPHTC